MIFKITSSALYNRLVIASKVIAAKNTMPILDCFYFNIHDDIATVMASDTDKYFITEVPLIEACEQAVSFCIKSKTLLDSIKELPEQPITFDFNPDTYNVKGYHNGGSFNILAQESNAYPTPQEIANDAFEVNLPTSVFIEGINYCLFATSNDEVRMVMTGINIDFKQDQIIFAGTDGRKLVRYTILEQANETEWSFILPKKIAGILKAILNKDQEEFKLKISKDKGYIIANDFKLYFSMIEGRYPNYNAVIPTTNPYKVTIDRQSLLMAMRRVTVLSNQSTGLIKFEVSTNSIRITGQDYDYATSAEENLVCEYEGRNICIGFSGQFLIEILSAMTAENVTIELSDPSRPGLFTCETNHKNEELLMLLMPMRVDE